MANEEQLAIWQQGVWAWNSWRNKNPNAEIDLSNTQLIHQIRWSITLDGGGTEVSSGPTYGSAHNKVNLSNANLKGSILSYGDLRDADFHQANLNGAELNNANLTGAVLVKANLKKTMFVASTLTEAKLYGANLTGANLIKANLTKANLGKAKMINAKLDEAQLIKTIFDGATISGSSVYGVNVWDLEGEFKEQRNLIINPPGKSSITVDNIKVAQFIYLLLDNKEIRDVINTLTSKSVLILGRFAIPERKAILDALRNKLREYDLLPIVFDFDRPIDKDFTETIKTLAGISYFVIADVTNPKSSPLELQATVPDYQIPFVPIIQEGESPFAMMANLQTKYNWVLDTISYDSIDTLIKLLKHHIIDPAIKKHDELRLKKARVPTVISGKELIKKKGKRKSSRK